MEVESGLEIQFLHGRMYTKNVSVARLLNHLEIARQFRRLSTREGTPDVILSSYPTIELCDEAVQYGTRHNVPVLLDIRDLWPDEMSAHIPARLRSLAPIVLWPVYHRARRSLSGASGIIAISRTYMDWARRLAGRSTGPCDLWVPFGYQLPDRARPIPPEIEAKLLSAGVNPSRKIVWFSGTFVGSIDLGTAIEAARLLAGRSDFQFVLTGSGENEAIWREQARGLGNVVFTGWAGRDELAWLSKHAWLGLGAYKRNALMSLPNKLFEYMSAGLPILSCLEGEARELIEHYDIGRSYRAGSCDDLAARIQEIGANSALRTRLAVNALSAFREHFTAELVYGRFADHLERCARRVRAKATSASAIV